MIFRESNAIFSFIMKELSENTLKTYRNGPLYMRVRDLLIDYIAELPPEEEYLPYEYEMEKLLKVSRQSIRHALQELRSEGMLETVRNRGSRILLRRRPSVPRPESCLERQVIAQLFVSDQEDEARTEYWSWNLASEIEKILNTRNATLELFNMRSTQYRNNPEEVLSRLRSQNVRVAIVQFHKRIDPFFWPACLLEAGIKPVLVFLGSEDFRRHFCFCSPGVDTITVNHEEAILHKLNLSYRNAGKLCYVVHPADLDWAESRMDVIRRFAERCSIPLECLVEGGERSLEIEEKRKLAGYRIFKKYAKKMLPDEHPVFLAANDDYAIGILEAIRELQLQDRKISVIGYDNFLQNRSFGISTFDYNVSAMAEAAVELIESALRHPEKSRNYSTGKFIRPTYIRRKTAD